MAADQSALEAQLDSFDPQQRQEALQALAEQAASGAIQVQAERDWLNLHCHSFCSYNGYGASPSRLVWEAKKLGLFAVGLVDFDVLDGVDEFHAAGRTLSMRTTAGMETRVYIPEFSTREINSPGEPGVAYHMGSGFVSGSTGDAATSAVLDDLRARARARNLQVLDAVNPFLDPVSLDYDADVVPMTPFGVATERHLCAAYQAKGEAVFADEAERTQFWSDKLGSDCAGLDAAKLQALIRSKTMKRGGIGYQQPDEGTFPLMSSVNKASLALGAIPTLTWLDGTREGEAALDEMMDLQAADGVCAVNIVPDRNWNIADADDKKLKIAKLEEFVAAADKRGWPVQIGTELNAPGLKWVDDFDAPELANVVDSFRRGARIMFGHSVAQAANGQGYTSAWAAEQFADVEAKNAYYADLGEKTSSLPEVSA